MSERCRKCRIKVKEVKFCDDCHYPGIEDDYAEYLELIKDGVTRAQAAVMSGWKGVEEI